MPVLIRSMTGSMRSGGDAQLHAEHQLVALARVSTCLGVNWASGATKLTLARAAYSGATSRTIRALAPILSSRRSEPAGRSPYTHPEVHEGEDLAAAAEHLALLGKAVEYATLDGGLEGHVVDPRLDPRSLGLGRFDRLPGRVEPGLLAVDAARRVLAKVSLMS